MTSRAAGAVLFRRPPASKPEYLLLRNALHRTWGFPKGHLEPGEDDGKAMVREIEEETGLTSSHYALVPDFKETLTYPVRLETGQRVRKTVVYFLAECAVDVVVRLSMEHDELAWEPAETAMSLIAFPNMRRLLAAADERLCGAGDTDPHRPSPSARP